ncbi:hypothetical protein PSEUBRA_003811 [Kalmanozyma brasiliensis GHG001]|uniref:uncharacterized protein n=1 Tax=Kalmanozyma brasiliensis (strain GHG001) TaxID=1365824 RepID=UPI001CEB4A78|nr:uncharacterized protein PSEUBRA_003811 [Kalmanozyma brasiliensis GHG001]KAF6767295.1 hypothetical protein PSEUBRA_003811 [Kalmanozyma brasiliensis GHG001]
MRSLIVLVLAFFAATALSAPMAGEMEKVATSGAEAISEELSHLDLGHARPPTPPAPNALSGQTSRMNFARPPPLHVPPPSAEGPLVADLGSASSGSGRRPFASPDQVIPVNDGGAKDRLRNVVGKIVKPARSGNRRLDRQPSMNENQWKALFAEHDFDPAKWVNEDKSRFAGDRAKQAMFRF